MPRFFLIGALLFFGLFQIAHAQSSANQRICVYRYNRPQPDPVTGELKQEYCWDFTEVGNLRALPEADARNECAKQCDPRLNDPAAAQCYFITTENCSTYKNTPSGEFEGVPLEDELRRLREEAAGVNQIQGVSATALVGRIIRAVMGVMGSIALIMFIYGGLMWMTARGNSEKAAKALQTILWGGLGVAVILSSYAVISFIFEAFR